jgi:hypothetical protein
MQGDPVRPRRHVHELQLEADAVPRIEQTYDTERRRTGAGKARFEAGTGDIHALPGILRTGATGQCSRQSRGCCYSTERIHDSNCCISGAVGGTGVHPHLRAIV